MEKIVCLCFCFIVILSTCCGCSGMTIKGSTDTASAEPVTVNMPTDNSVNGYRTYGNTTPDGITVINSGVSENSEDTDYCGEYVANTNSNKFHKSSCSSAKKMNEENKYISNSREDMISRGYEPCKRCNR